jgi:predicted ferric reductase
MTLLTEPRVSDLVTPARKRRIDSSLPVLLFFSIQFGIAVALGFTSQPLSSWVYSPEAFALNLSRVTALVGTAIALTSIALASRAPWVERAMGQDRMIFWHRKIGPYSLFLIAAHVVLLSFARTENTSFNTWESFWDITVTTRWMVPAALGFVLMVGIGITSYHRIRKLFKYETWWVIHLYSYIGIALAFMHQIESGVMFRDDPLLKQWWIFYYASVFLLLLRYRVWKPIALSFSNRPRISKVVRENSDTVSLHLNTRNRKLKKVKGGQYFNIRILEDTKWWEAHPYSLSAPPKNGELVFTIKELGDHSSWLTTMPAGTPVQIEGPYGIFTTERLRGNKVLFIAGGIGITPIKAMVEDLPAGVTGTVLWRVSKETDLILLEELKTLCAERGIELVTVVGSRTENPLWLEKTVTALADYKEYEVFICASKGLIHTSKDSLLHLGLNKKNIYTEEFEF